jgi:predicted transcriptional regulator
MDAIGRIQSLRLGQIEPLPSDQYANHPYYKLPAIIMSHLPRPTKAELDILQVLWNSGPSTVRQVHQQVSAESGVGYTTTLKLMQLMLEKQLVSRDESAQAHVYMAEVKPSHWVGGIINRFFNGSMNQLVQEALSGHRPDDSELKAIKKTLAEFEKQNRADDKPTKSEKKSSRKK